MDVAKKLSLTYNPVGIWFKDEKPEGAFEFDPATRPCVVSMLVAASKGKTVAVSDEACTCPGGAVGLGFGDAFERRDAPTMWMLAHGPRVSRLAERAYPAARHGARRTVLLLKRGVK